MTSNTSSNKTHNYHTHNQVSQYSSPWSFSYRLKIIIWQITWNLLCSWTPKPMNLWRLFILRLFQAQISGKPFIHQKAIIEHPWNLKIEDKACIGESAHIYNLGYVTIKRGSIIAQEAYICTGTHDFSQKHFPLQTSPVFIEENSFIGARAFILPGILIEKNAVIGACSVVTKDVSKNTLVAGNPAKVIRNF